MKRKAWVLATVAVVVALAAAGGVLVTSGARDQAMAAQRPPVSTADVEKMTLSAVVSEAGILTYRARPDGSPYSVINQARGTYTELPAPG